MMENNVQEDGTLVPERVPSFPFYCCRNHFRYLPFNFLFQYGHLTNQEVADYDKLWTYFTQFSI